jgi:hypothetical protein
MNYQTPGWSHLGFWTGVAHGKFDMVINGHVESFTIILRETSTIGVYYSWETEVGVPGNYGNFCGACLNLYQPICI